MSDYRPHMLPKVRSDELMASARGKPCTLRISSFIPGHACSGRDTTVSAHLPIWGKGTGTKVTDIATVYGCSNCHAILDGQDWKGHDFVMNNYRVGVLERMLHAITETHTMMVMDGVISVKGARIV